MFLFRYLLDTSFRFNLFCPYAIKRQNMSKEVLEESLLLTRSGAGRRPIRHRVGGQQKGAFIIELSTASCWYRLKTKHKS